LKCLINHFFIGIPPDMRNCSPLLLLVLASLVSSQFTLGPDGEAPMRPEDGFTSKQDLHAYLKALRRYYAIVSRPRYVHMNMITDQHYFG